MKKFVLGLVLAMAGMGGIAPLAAEHHNPLAGPAFSDPTKEIEMTEEWKKQPVTYDPWAKDAQVAVALDQQIYHTLKGDIDRFMQETGVKVAVREGTCGISSGMMIRKQVDSAGLCCPAGETDRLPGLKFHTLGIAAEVFMVHPSNPLDTISLADLRQVFQGAHYRWSELKDSQGRPGPDLPIQTIGRLHCKLRPGHWRLLLDNADDFSPRMQEVGTIPDMVYQVAGNPGAIGNETLLHMVRNNEKGVPKALNVNGHAPTFDNITALRYPLYRTFVLTTWHGPGMDNPKAVQLVEYLIKAVERLDPGYGMVPTSLLKKAGWKFKDNELVGEPGS